MTRPLIGITCDVDAEDGRRFIRPAYARAVMRAGGVPVILAPECDLIPHYLESLSGFVLSGGDDPIMEEFGTATHPAATKVHPERQAFEIALLRALDGRPEVPVLGICLGMQYMALHAGGAIDQHLPQSRPEIAGRHWGRVEHEIVIHPSPLGRGAGLRRAQSSRGEGARRVLSHHRQAIVDSGLLEVCARCAADDLIEAVCDPARPFYLGVQWHPERTDDDRAGPALFRELIGRARSHGFSPGASCAKNR